MGLGVSNTRILAAAVGTAPTQAPSNATVDAAIDGVADDLAGHTVSTTGAHGMSAFGASLVDDVSASAARTTMGLGTAATSDTTAFDAAGAAAAVNSTLSTHVALATAHGISSFGSTLVDDIDAANARGTLGLGSAATKTAPASGNAASGEVVLGNDTRLTDSRTPTSHNHAASEITTGTIATARLGSGTASSSTYLRGDQTWETISGGGASALDDLSDVAITSAVSGNFLRHNGTQFVNATIAAGDIPSGFNLTGQSLFSANTNYTGTSGAFTVEPCTITFPSTGCYRVTALIPLRILVAATVTSQLACGTCAISHANGDVIGTCDNSRAGSVAACTVSTGSPTTISLASRPDIANMAWLGELIIDVTTAGTMKLQLAGAGSTANHFTVLKGTMLRWEKVS